MDIAKNNATTSPVENAVVKATQLITASRVQQSVFIAVDPYRVVDKTCTVQVKVQAILDIQNKHKVGKRRGEHL